MNIRAIALIFVLAVGAIVFFSMGSKRTTPPAPKGLVVEPIEDGGSVAKRQLAPDEDEDVAVIKLMKDSGADLSLPRLVEVYLYFRSEKAAQAAAAKVALEGFDASVRILPTGDISCKGEKTMVVTISEIRRMGAVLSKVASEGQGEYDGWEASALPEEQKRQKRG